jgi:hypothetical protein
MCSVCTICFVSVRHIALARATNAARLNGRPPCVAGALGDDAGDVAGGWDVVGACELTAAWEPELHPAAVTTAATASSAAQARALAR